MQKIIIYFILLFIPLRYNPFYRETTPEPATTTYQQLYSEMQLENVVNYVIFELAMVGYDKLEVPNKEVVTLIDYSKPSTEERLYVLNMKEKKLLFSSLVSHGKNSGADFATSFSNKSGSHKSSLGFYVTGNTYLGGNGNSLILNGLEKGFNDRAKDRAIVIHAAKYCNADYVSEHGMLGRSYGCPALPKEINDTIINTIKDGTLLFIYANNQYYLSKSRLLRK